MILSHSCVQGANRKSAGSTIRNLRRACSWPEKDAGEHAVWSQKRRSVMKPAETFPAYEASEQLFLELMRSHLRRQYPVLLNTLMGTTDKQICTLPCFRFRETCAGSVQWAQLHDDHKVNNRNSAFTLQNNYYVHVCDLPTHSFQDDITLQRKLSQIQLLLQDRPELFHQKPLCWQTPVRHQTGLIQMNKSAAFYTRRA